MFPKEEKVIYDAVLVFLQKDGKVLLPRKMKKSEKEIGTVMAAALKIMKHRFKPQSVNLKKKGESLFGRNG